MQIDKTAGIGANFVASFQQPHRVERKESPFWKRENQGWNMLKPGKAKISA